MKFTPDDFKTTQGFNTEKAFRMLDAITAAELANTRLVELLSHNPTVLEQANALVQDMLAEAPVVHCRQQGSLWIATESQDEYDTHKARLVQIEELK